MAISQKLHTKLVQKLILTPSLQQAIKLLPMSTLELSELLNQEMVENPMLEEVPTEELQPVEAAPEKQEEKPSEKKADSWDDQDYEYFFGDYLDDGYRPRTPTEVKELPPIENTLSTGQSLSDHLLWQLSMQTDEPLIREIGEAIIGNLDDDGYLVATVEELAGMGPWPLEEVERALKLVQGFDPIGVAARDLQECLLLQLRHLGMTGTPADQIVTEHMRLLQNHQVPELARKLGLTIDDLKQHIELIRHLDPKPGSRYNPSQSQYVIPDVYIVKIEDQYVAALNEEGLPQLRISPVYRRLLDKNVAGEHRRDARLREGQVPFGAVVDQVGGAAPEDDPQGGLEHHQLPARLPRSRHRVSAAARPARRGQRHRDARVDGQSRGHEQVHAHAARRVRDEVLLPQRHLELLWRGGLLGHDQAAHSEDHRAGRSQEAVERFQDRQHPSARGARAGTPDDCKVSGRAQDPHIQPTQGSVPETSGPRP